MNLQDKRLLKVLGIGVLLGLFILLLENQADSPLTRLLKDKDFSEEVNPSRFNFGSVLCVLPGLVPACTKC